MKLTKLTAEEAQPIFCNLPEFGEPASVQGGTLRKAGNALLAEARRYKLFGAKRDFIKITAGSGFIKWARGETKFSAGDCFLAEDVSEYEVNGAEQFLVVRR
ncbi:MAG: hypothetical protein K2H43_03195 [Clostridia bacterium]|nr:hypothetical protein [Clostridia bacterium]